MSRKIQFKTAAPVADETTNRSSGFSLLAVGEAVYSTIDALLFDTLATMWGKLNERARFALTLAFGVFFGLVVLGWYVFPVEWVGASFANMPVERQAMVVNLAADLNSFDGDNPKVTTILRDWPTLGPVACEHAAVEIDLAQKARYIALAYRVGVECGK